MKTFIIIALICCIAAAVSATDADIKQQDKNITTYVDECKKEHKISAEMYDKIRAGKIEDATEDVQCFADCFMKKAGIVKDGKLQDEAVKEKFAVRVGAENAEKILNNCRTNTGSTECEYAYNLHRCFLTNKAY